MMYLAALFLGVATWMENPIASGVLVTLGVLFTVSWVQSWLMQLASNQKKIWIHINRR